MFIVAVGVESVTGVVVILVVAAVGVVAADVEIHEFTAAREEVLL